MCYKPNKTRTKNRSRRNITQIQQYVEIENEEYIKESINQINIIIAEAKENIKDYKITRMSKEYYEEKMQKLEQIAGEI